MCPPLAALDLTLKLQEVGQTNNLQMEVMDRLRGAYVDLMQIAGWASRMLKEYRAERGRDRREMDGLDRKRGALHDLDPGPKRIATGPGIGGPSIQLIEFVEPVAEDYLVSSNIGNTGEGESRINHAKLPARIKSQIEILSQLDISVEETPGRGI